MTPDYVAELRLLYEELLDLIPPGECSCHITPPCTFCTASPTPELKDMIERLPVIIQGLERDLGK